MPTLKELKRENERLRNKIKAKKDLISIGEERNKLLRENKALMRQMKYGSSLSVAQKFGEKGARYGKKLGKNLLILGRKIEAAQREEEMLRRKIENKRRVKAKKKTTTKKRKSSSRSKKKTSKSKRGR